MDVKLDNISVIQYLLAEIILQQVHMVKMLLLVQLRILIVVLYTYIN